MEEQLHSFTSNGILIPHPKVEDVSYVYPGSEDIIKITVDKLSKFHQIGDVFMAGVDNTKLFVYRWLIDSNTIVCEVIGNGNPDKGEYLINIGWNRFRED